VLAVRNLVLKVGLGGEVYLDGRPVTGSELDAAIIALNTEGGFVTYYRESPETEGSAAAAAAFKDLLARRPKIRLGNTAPSEWGTLQWIEIEETPHLSRFFLAASQRFLISFPARPGQKQVVFVGGPLSTKSESAWLGQLDFIIRSDRVMETPLHNAHLCFTPAASAEPSLHLRISYPPERRWAARYLPAKIPGNIASFHADVMRVAGRTTSGTGSGEPKPAV
jgi:hypothetical protein